MTIRLNVLRVNLKDMIEKLKTKLTEVKSRKFILQDLHLENFVVRLK